MMLVVTLVIVMLLALLGASFAFRMNADVAAVTAQHDLQEARLAAESGIDRAIMVLRDQRTDMDQWWNNSKLFRRILVWAPDKIGASDSIADQEAVPGRPAWRFSIISYRLDGDNAKIRYGVTDEAGKINLNTASRAQLIALFDNVKHDENVTSMDLADAVLQWRGDKEVNPTVEAKLTDFYNKQNPPYKPKKRPFETVEELLMVKGFDGQFVYGEDYNRNGYLDPNEDDGADGAFPPDDGDGKLNRGLLPLVTVYSWDRNASNDNRQRVNINAANLAAPSGAGDGADAAAAATGKTSIRDLLAKEIRPEVLDFIAEARKRNFKFRSIGEMVGLEVYQDGSSNYDRTWRRFLRQLDQADKAQEANETGEEQASEDQSGMDDTHGSDSGGNQNNDLGPRRSNTRTQQDRNNTRNNSGGSDNGGNNGGSDTNADKNNKDNRKLQSIRGNSSRSGSNRSGSSRSGNRSGGSGGSFGLGNSNNASGSNSNTDDQNSSGSDSNSSGSRRNGGRNSGRSGSSGSRGSDAGSDSGSDNSNGDSNSGNNSRRGGRGGSGRNSGRDGSRSGDSNQDSGSDNGNENNNDNNADEQNGGNQNGNNAGGAAGGGSGGRGTPIVSPVTAEDLPALMDRLTTMTMPIIAGQVNVNTAPIEVLRTLPGVGEAEAESIAAKRTQLSGVDKVTPAWLVTSGALPAEQFGLISNLLTTRSLQYTIESIGFADHVGAAKRIQVVVEFKGQLAQIKYYRDITSLGIGYPVRDDERSEGFAFTDR